jgi:hypothetical protein
MDTVLHERKAAQAAAYLLKLHGRPMPAAQLLTLLYLAERRSWAETGAPLTGDRMALVPDGPEPGPAPAEPE